MIADRAISSAVEGSGAGSGGAFLLAVASVADVVREKGEEIRENPDAEVLLDFTDTREIEKEHGQGRGPRFKVLVSEIRKHSSKLQIHWLKPFQMLITKLRTQRI